MRLSNLPKFIGLVVDDSALNREVSVPAVQVSDLSPLKYWAGESLRDLS